MGLLRNRPVEDGQPQSSVPQLPANDQMVIEPRATGAPHPGNASSHSGEGTLGASKTLEIPVEELRRLAQSSANDRTSTGVRGKILLFAAAMIVVSGIVAWHHYGQAAMATLSSASVAPALVSSQPAVTQSSSDITAGDPTAPEAIAPQPAQQAVAIQPALQQMTPPGAAPELLQQLEAVSRELVVVHQVLQQMASKQDDMARNIAALQASNDDLKKKLAPPRLTGAIPVQPRKPSVAAAPTQTVGQPSLPPPPIADAPLSASNKPVPDPRWPGVSRPPSAMRNN